MLKSLSKCFQSPLNPPADGKTEKNFIWINPLISIREMAVSLWSFVWWELDRDSTLGPGMPDTLGPNEAGMTLHNLGTVRWAHFAIL